MSNDVATQEPFGSTLADPSRLEQALKLADAMATAKTLPDHLRGSPGDCLRVIELSFRIGLSPFALGDRTYFVRGKLAMEGQLVAAIINAHPRVEERLSYTYEGNPEKPDTLKCRVTGKLHGERERYVDVAWKTGHQQAQGARDKWTQIPEQMLSYYGARTWARRHAPEILLGIHSEDEIVQEQMRDITPEASPTDDPMDQFEAQTGAAPAVDQHQRASAAGEPENGPTAAPAMFELTNATGRKKTFPAGEVGERLLDMIQDNPSSAKKLLDANIGVIGQLDRETQENIEAAVITAEKDAEEQRNLV